MHSWRMPREARPAPRPLLRASRPHSYLSLLNSASVPPGLVKVATVHEHKDSAIDAATSQHFCPLMDPESIALSVLPLQTRRSFEGVLHWLSREIRFAAWAAIGTPGYGWLVSATGTLMLSEFVQPVSVRGYASRRAIAGALVRINLDFDNV